MEKLIIDNMEYAEKIARYRWSKCKSKYSLDEIISCAYTGLVIAAKKYDKSQNIDFKHYAGKRIKGEISNLIARDKTYNVKRGVPHENPILSLNNHCGDDNSEFIDFVQEKEDHLSDMFLADEIDKLLSILSAKERDVIEMYFLRGMLQEEIAEILNINQSTVSRILKKSIKKLKGCNTTGQ